jgi:hypothetical protein
VTSTDRDPIAMRARVGAAAVLGVALLAGCGTGSSTGTSTQATAQRQAQVRENGAAVMPFDLDKTTHSFVDTDGGGVQTVVARDETDAEQVRLIREHMTTIAAEFSAGNFSDPAMIHGADMPGLKTLEQNASALSIVPAEVPGGAQLTYSSSDPIVVAALHDWFAAQLADHGADAMSGSMDHPMSREMWQAHHPGEPYPGDSASP